MRTFGVLCGPPTGQPVSQPERELGSPRALHAMRDLNFGILLSRKDIYLQMVLTLAHN
jgi:hypothetical protein